MQKKDDKVGNKTANEEERQRKKTESKREVQILALAHVWKTKKLFNYIRLVGKYASFLTKQVFSHSYAN